MRKILAAGLWAVLAWGSAGKAIGAEGSANEINSPAGADHLSRAVQFKTISYQDPAKFDPAPFLGIQSYLEKTYPLLHQNLRKELVANYTLLYKWEGTDPSLKPILLMGHQDVVPAGPENEWTQPPFSGKIADGFIWGRGTLDDKVSLMGILEAVEYLLGKGFQPKRSIYICSSHDEEVGGSGTVAVAALLKSRGVSLEYVLDEGGSVTTGVIPGVQKPVALVAIAEKGYLSVQLSVETKGGHASAPSLDNSIGILATAIHNLERHQFPAALKGVTEQTFQAVLPYLEPKMQFIFKNRWLFGPAIIQELEKSQAGNATLRTTIAPTIINAGEKENILPRKATAIVNLRLMEGDTIGYVLNHINRAINDPRVKVSILGRANQASKVSDLNSEWYRTLAKTIQEIYPDAVVAPLLEIGATDSRHFQELTDNIFRFTPTFLNGEDLERAHNINERIGVDNYGQVVKFYILFIQDSER